MGSYRFFSPATRRAPRGLGARLLECVFEGIDIHGRFEDLLKRVPALAPPPADLLVGGRVVRRRMRHESEVIVAMRKRGCIRRHLADGTVRLLERDRAQRRRHGSGVRHERLIRGLRGAAVMLDLL